MPPSLKINKIIVTLIILKLFHTTILYWSAENTINHNDRIAIQTNTKLPIAYDTYATQHIRHPSTYVTKPRPSSANISDGQGAKRFSRMMKARFNLDNRNRSYNFNSDCTMYADDLRRELETEVNVCGVRKTHNTHAQTTLIGSEVTLLSQLSINRIESLKRLIKQWPGHISVAIYTGIDKFANDSSDICRELDIGRRTNVQIHLVHGFTLWYHINYLRNVAQDNALTEYVFMSDVDFQLMPNLYERLTQDIKVFFSEQNSLTNVLTIPSLMAYPNCTFPDSKAKVQNEWDICVSRFDYGFPGFTGDPTNYTRWKTAPETYEIPYVFHFEPYLVIKKEHSPRYEENFLQRWYDKMSHVYQLYSRGFKFWAYPHGYMVHMPHESAPLDEFMYEKSKQCATHYLHHNFRLYMVRAQRKQNLPIIARWVH